MPRCPPASRPCAITPSTPCASSQRASATVVAEERVKAPAALTRASKPGCGKPKWKLTTAGRASSTTTHMASSKGARAAVQDGFDLYLHGFVVTNDGRWVVVQQNSLMVAHQISLSMGASIA